MPFKDYLRSWTVLPGADPLAKCQKDQIVTFQGGLPPDEVTVLCDGKSVYAEGIYMEQTDTIERKGEYTISRLAVTKYPRIGFTPEGGLAGSWTAEDQSPWLGPEPA